MALAAGTTVYVRTDGNDANDGTVNDSSHAFLTIQAACNSVSGKTIPTGAATIQIGDGTYTITAPITLPNFVGAGVLLINGNAVTPSNVVVNNTADLGVIGGMFSVNASLCQVRLQHFKVSASGRCCVLVATGGGYMEFQDLVFGSFTNTFAHILALSCGIIVGLGSYSITANVQRHINASSGGCIRIQNAVITLTGTPAWANTFAVVNQLSIVDLGTNNSYSGSATGQRYDVEQNSMLITNSGNVNLLPGNSAGSALTGGIYT